MAIKKSLAWFWAGELFPLVAVLVFGLGVFLQLDAKAEQLRKPCSIFMHSFEPPEGYVEAQAFPLETGGIGMIYRYEDNSAIAIFPSREDPAE